MFTVSSSWRKTTATWHWVPICIPGNSSWFFTRLSSCMNAGEIRCTCRVDKHDRLPRYHECAGSDDMWCIGSGAWWSRLQREAKAWGQKHRYLRTGQICCVLLTNGKIVGTVLLAIGISTFQERIKDGGKTMTQQFGNSVNEGGR